MEEWKILVIIISGLIGLIYISVGVILIFLISKKQQELEAQRQREREIERQKIKNWLNNPDGIVYEQWQLIARKYGSVGDFKLKYQGLKGKLKEADHSAIYVLKNLANDFYYVGQSINVYRRVNQHFSGKGNGNVYADYKYGQDFQVNIIPVEKGRLNEIEFNLIKILNANGAKGYNISKGIKSTNFKF